MIELQVSAADLRRVRFATSPLRETVMSLRALAARGTAERLHEPWRARAAQDLAQLDPSTFDLLAALVRPQGYIPDFLAPSPKRRWAAFTQEIAHVAAAEPRQVAHELAHLAQHRLAQQGPGVTARRDLLQRLVDQPDAGLGMIVAALTDYHRMAIAPYWPRLRALLQEDIAYRLQALAAGGFEEMMRDLHPSVRFDTDTIRIVKYYNGTAELAGRGLLLMPSAFAWPDVIVRTAEPDTPAMSYSPRGIARLWIEHPGSPRPALAAVIGATRAALLAQLDLPMSTTQAATQLALSAPTLNVHLQALRRCGLLRSFRDGRHVLYTRTDLGNMLLTGAHDDGQDFGRCHPPRMTPAEQISVDAGQVGGT